jgi:hypothetical protein
VRRSLRDIGQELSDVHRGEHTQVPSCIVGSPARLDLRRHLLQPYDSGCETQHHSFYHASHYSKLHVTVCNG